MQPIKNYLQFNSLACDLKKRTVKTFSVPKFHGKQTARKIIVVKNNGI